MLLSNRGEGGLSSRFSSRPPRSLSRFQDHGPGRLHTVIVEPSSTDFVFTAAKLCRPIFLFAEGEREGGGEGRDEGNVRIRRDPGLNLRRSVTVVDRGRMSIIDAFCERPLPLFRAERIISFRYSSAYLPAFRPMTAVHRRRRRRRVVRPDTAFLQLLARKL